MISYSETDLICYRAGDISALVKRQSELLDPVTRWAEGRFGIALAITDGLMPVKQPASNKAKLKAALADYDDWRLAALAVAVKSLGSLIIGLALTEGRLGGTEAFHLSQLEERYETEKWGGDEEKDARMRKLEEEIIAAERFLRLL
jgi:chaperone required for assembly of F1-ATPase